MKEGYERTKNAAATVSVKDFIALFQHYGFSARRGKAWFYFLLSISLTACTSGAPKSTTPNAIRVLLDRPPTTLNPRMAADSNGQRFGELLYAALTLKDAEMRPQPYLAESWSVQDHGLAWVFKIRPGQKDHSGQEITPQRLATCFNEYLQGKPRSILMAGFTSLKSIEARENELVFQLNRPDPYLATNLTLFRYFTTGDPSKPCHEPGANDHIVTSGSYHLPKFDYEDLTPEHSLELIPVEAGRRALFFTWTMDDNSKALQLIRGDVDVASTSVSLTKTRWIEKNYADRFRVIERPNGVNVSYLAFNLRQPDLKKLEVRKAIALAIDREDFVQNKLMGFGTPAGTLLSPVLSESVPQSVEYNPKKAEQLLDQAGYPRDKNGVRLRLRFKTTSVRDGFETALALQYALHKIGIELTLDVVEPAVFFASIRKGAFELFTSRWIGVSDASIFYRTLKTGNPDNRDGYSNPEIDALLEQSQLETDPARRKDILAKIQAKVIEDLPYLPLWYWNPSTILRKDLTGLEARDLSLSGSLAPLAHLR
jgi:peptide/nickel transport system substrate-binding protein